MEDLVELFGASKVDIVNIENEMVALMAEQGHLR